jgi:hypothetical protein
MADIIVFNLFALEGLVIADVTGIPAVALHPYPPPPAKNTEGRYPHGGPEGLRARLQEEWPYLLQQLTIGSELEARKAKSAQPVDKATKSLLSFEEFEHWVSTL